LNFRSGGLVTRVLAFDPGAERMGFACIAKGEENKDPVYYGSGHFGLSRKGNESSYQEYRLNLIALWVEEAPKLIGAHQPDIVVNEIVPPVGGSGANQVQRQLATTAITTIQAVAIQSGLPIRQIGANTVKARIGGGKKASKVQVRNGVLHLMPDMQHKKKEWTKVFDECDAFAVALTELGYQVGR
jgi:Holliday junction resolvasome RuvABC endonuclease subunit